MVDQPAVKLVQCVCFSADCDCSSDGNLLRQKLAELSEKEGSCPPVKVITWDKLERIKRYQEIWSDEQSVVHRLPEHYKQRFWENLLRDRTPVHYRKPKERFTWDEKNNINIENQEYPIVGIYPPEADLGLWGGEAVVKGYKVSRPFTHKKILPRQWVPHFWWPALKRQVLYSEILDRYMSTIVTDRALRLIDENFGLDSYILRTAEIDLCSKLGNKLKREMLCALAKGLYNLKDNKQRQFLLNKYQEFIIPLEEAEWIGLDLNEACQKLQDLEQDTSTGPKIPKKLEFEAETVQRLSEGEIRGEMTWKDTAGKFLERFSMKT